MRTGTTVMFLVASVLGLLFGVAMVKERRTPSILPTIATGALLATVATSIAFLSAGEGGVDVLLIFFPLAVVIGIPVAAGALLGATWRLVLRLLERRSTHP